MAWADHCRKVFRGANPDVEDLYLLESYQIASLRERAPRQELAAVLRANPTLERFFVNKCPEIADFLEGLGRRFSTTSSGAELERLSDSLVWEIADMIVYCKQPKLYDEQVVLDWSFADVLAVVSIDDKVVVDGGAGTGRVAFEAAGKARHVFAVEPNTSLRRFIGQKAKERAVRNIYPIDGFLDAIPLPDDSVDVLITSNAIGWRLESELREIERVVQTGGHAVHIASRSKDIEHDSRFDVMTSPDWRYQRTGDDEGEGLTIMYHKRV